VRRKTRCVSSGLFWFSAITLLWMASAVVVGQQDEIGVPDQVTASDEIYSDRIDVHWNAVEGATRYELYRSTFLKYMYIPIAFTTELQISDREIQASQYYYYKVKACSEELCGPFSESDVGSWAIGVPEGAFATRGRYADKIRIEWNPVVNATFYYVYRSDEPENLDALLYMGYEPFLDDFGALAGKTYYYHVRALTTSTGSDLTDPLPGYRDATLSMIERFHLLTEAESEIN
jgi:fibronectin type 3 domain-containing protein